MVATVFDLKLNALMTDITKKMVLGKVASYIYTIEFQKRGLPHTHILLIMDLDDHITTVEDIDNVVCAEIPDPNVDAELYRIVTTNMLHGPCTPQRCMKNGRCSKSFPKPFEQNTTIQEDGYPRYCRRENRLPVIIRGHAYDNRWVVPYNPYLSKRYNAHINVEVCSGVRAVKYIYKYVYKGHDRATVAVDNGQDQNDEITMFQDARYVGAPEAAWRLLHYPLQRRAPSICRLQVHGTLPRFIDIDPLAW